PWMVLSERPRSCSSARKRLSSKAFSSSRFSTPPERRYQSIFCWYQSMVRWLRPITFSSSSHSRSSARTGCNPRRGWTLAPSSTGAGTAAPPNRSGATFGGRPALRRNPPRGLFTVCVFHNGFWRFSTDFAPSRRLDYRCPKTTKTGPQGRLSEFNLRGGSPLRKSGGEGEIRTLDGAVTHNGFRDRRLQPLGHLSETRAALFIPHVPGAQMAVPTGFEPAFSALTGPRVWPGYTTGPAAAKSTNGLGITPN